MFKGHTKDVLSVAFSADNRQIVSGSRDKTIKLWNTLGVCKYTIQVTTYIDQLSTLNGARHGEKVSSDSLCQSVKWHVKTSGQY